MKYLPFVLILLVFSCTKDIETIKDGGVPSLDSFVGDYNKLIIRTEVNSMGGGERDTIFETISFSQINDSLYNYQISNTQINHEVLYDRKIGEYYLYRSRSSNSKYTLFEHYVSNDSISVFSRIGGLGQWIEYETFIKQ